ALFAEHRNHLVELAAAYRAVANAQGLTVQMLRYDLPTEGATATPPPAGLIPILSPADAERARNMPPPDRQTQGVRGILSSDPKESPTIETRVPPTTWVGKRYFQTNPAKLLLVREDVDPMRPDQYQTDDTIGLALHIAGNGAHVRFSGDA